MIYSYKCLTCNVDCDVVKPLADYDKIEHCGKCGNSMQRAFAPQKIYLSGTAVQDRRWSNAFGQVVRSDAHERQIAKERGAIELWTENPHKHLKPNLKSYDD